MTRALLVLLAPFAALFFACVPGQTSNSGCETNADCPDGRFCALNGDCVECRENAQCGDAQFCCQGVCYDEGEQAAHCGCAADRGSSGAASALSGDACSDDTNVCLVNNAPATADNVADGICGCSCDAAAGGTLCSVDEAGALACSCSRSDPEGTCERPALDANGNPHIVADTCSPQEVCVCFAGGGAACDPSGDAPDCTATGCVNALGDVDNCGVGGRVCGDPASGSDDGTGVCNQGGCSCDQNTDCQGTALNVNLCAFVGAVSQCVCDDYEVSEGEKAACPLGLECGNGGCLFDGASYATRAALLQALGVPVTE